MSRWTLSVVLALVVASTVSCGQRGANKGVAGAVLAVEAPFGPGIVYDPLRKPVAEIPFPNDLMLRPSDETATGLSWNISTEAPTAVERRIRREMGKLDGFGVYSPVFIPFDGPIDLDTVSDDTVMLINIEPDHPGRGERVRFDLDRGHFPETMSPENYWPYDADAALHDLYFAPDNEGTVDGEVRRVTYWEVETNTLILRPIKPLAPGCRHAVLVTRGIRGNGVDAEGQEVSAPVRSPWPYKAHAAQAEFVRDAADLVALSLNDLAFGWTYTTTDAATPMKNLREGVHGRGPLAQLGETAPAHIAEIRHNGVNHDGDSDGDGKPDVAGDHPYILQGSFLGELFGVIGQLVPGLSVDFDDVDYLVMGSFHTPGIRTGEDQMVGVNFHTGEGTVDVENVPFMITVPKAVPGRHEPPFPVVFYFHGTATSRMEALAIANQMARQGLAMLSFDQVGHGPIIPDIPTMVASQQFDIESLEPFLVPLLLDLFFAPDRAEELEDVSWDELLVLLGDVGIWNELALFGRTEDQNGDGILESSEGFFWANPFKMCGSIWQDLSDFFHAVATLRGFSPAEVPDALEDPASADIETLQPYFLAGDFNADGVIDVGGPDVQLSVAGTSLGGLHSILAAAIEPEVTVATPVVGGGGIVDLMMRTDFKMIVKRIFLETFGPLVVGCPDGEGGVWLSFNDDSRDCRPEPAEAESFAHIIDLVPGSLVRLVNHDNDETAALYTNARLGFSLAVPTDVGDKLELSVLRPGATSGSAWESVEVYSPYEGVAFQRNSPRFRRFMGIIGHVLDRCDPISVAHHLFLDPLPGHPPVDVLYEFALGDETVPISSGVQVALATGIFGVDEAEWGPVVSDLVNFGVMVGSDYDVDDLLQDNPLDAPPLGPFTPVPSSEGGVSSARFADVHGNHEWIIDVEADAELDAATYSQHQIVLYHWSQGGKVVDDLCIQELSCDILDDPAAHLP